ncbi:unnamed protein product, partial [Wuchereria bancrofti]
MFNNCPTLKQFLFLYGLDQSATFQIHCGDHNGSQNCYLVSTADDSG